jgi:hypothetical protein
MPDEPVEAELQDDLRRARRPSALPLDVFDPLEEAADIDEEAGKFRADGIERAAQALPRCNHGVRHRDRPPDGAAIASGER